MKIVYGGLMAVAILALAGCSQVEESKEPQEVIQNSNEALTVDPEAEIELVEQNGGFEELEKKLESEGSEDKSRSQQRTVGEGGEQNQINDVDTERGRGEKTVSDDVISKEAEKCIKEGGVYNSFAQKCFKD